MVAIQTPLQTTIVPDAEAFQHQHAVALSRWVAGRSNGAKKVVIDFSRAKTASTSAFARLVLLRRSLLKNGRDLRLMNLREEALGVYTVHRLSAVLPSA